MRKGILLVLVLGLMVFCAAKDSIAQGGPPVLEKVWASPVTPSGELLRIYIRASDPDGDMTWLCVAAGRGKQVTIGAFSMRINKEAGKSLNGYIYWDTSRAEKNISGTAAIMIEDSKGQQSETKSVFVEIKAGEDVKAEKAPAEFQDVPIGPVLLDNVRLPGRYLPLK